MSGEDLSFEVSGDAAKCMIGDFNIPGFVGKPNAPQRLELEKLRFRQERELNELESRHEQERSESRVDEPDQQLRGEKQQNERRELEERHQRENHRLIEDQRSRRIPPPRRLQKPLPTIQAKYHNPSRNPTTSPAATSSYTSTADATKLQSKDKPEDESNDQNLEDIFARMRREREEEIVGFREPLPCIRRIGVDPTLGRGFPPIKLPEPPFRPATAEERQAGPSHWLPIPRLKPAVEPVRQAPSKDEWERWWPNAWTPPDSTPRNGRPRPRPGEVLPVPVTTNKVRPCLGPGDVLPVPATTSNVGSRPGPGGNLRLPATTTTTTTTTKTFDQKSLSTSKEVKKKKNGKNRGPQPAAQPVHPMNLSFQAPPSNTDNRQGYGRGVNNGGYIPYPMPHGGIQQNQLPFHPPAASSFDTPFGQPLPQPGMGYGMNHPYPYGQPINVFIDNRHMSGHYGYSNPYSSPYASAAHYNPPPPHGHRDGLDTLSNVVAAQPPIPPHPQHDYVGHDDSLSPAWLHRLASIRALMVANRVAKDATATSATAAVPTPPPSSPSWQGPALNGPRQRPQGDTPSSPAEGLSSSIPQLLPLAYLGEGPGPASASAFAFSSSPRRARTVDHENDETILQTVETAESVHSGATTIVDPASSPPPARQADSADNGDTVLLPQQDD